MRPLPEPPAAGGLQLVSYKPLFSGPAVERVPELQFQRPQAEVELSPAEAERRGVRTGDEVTLRGAEITVTLRARVNKTLRDGVARVADEHSGGLRGPIDVAPAGVEAR